jgi:hypothetical protein
VKRASLSVILDIIVALSACGLGSSTTESDDTNLYHRRGVKSSLHSIFFLLD